MSNEDVAAAVGAQQEDDDAASIHEDGGNTLVQLQSQILELSKKQDAVMSNIARMGDAQTRSIIYVPREKQIVPFSGDPGKDDHTVDEFIEEVERVMKVRGLRKEEEVHFILSLLKGSALDEVKLRMGGQNKQPSDLFSYLRDAFREKRTTPQLLQAFYARKQLEGEDLRDYSHALSLLLNSAIRQSSSAVADAQLALRDQFSEGVRDPTLRRELRRLIREKPESNLFDVREEAIMWSLEDRPCSTSVARNRNLVGSSTENVLEKTNSTSKIQPDLTVTLQEVVKIISEQGKAITELTNAVRGLTTLSASTGGGGRGGKPRTQPRYTSDGQPICLRCEGVGHIARDCTAPRRPGGQVSSVPSAAVQGNTNPPSQ